MLKLHLSIIVGILFISFFSRNTYAQDLSTDITEFDSKSAFFNSLHFYVESLCEYKENTCKASKREIDISFCGGEDSYELIFYHPLVTADGYEFQNYLHRCRRINHQGKCIEFQHLIITPPAKL